nr:immunoglobulin heavy chain junction region [Macaca mulatta]
CVRYMVSAGRLDVW